MIPIYNCNEDYLRETLLSVLSQDTGSSDMQIEVIDNCSTVGDAEGLVRELGGGRIGFYRQSANIGMAGNFNACVRRARGYWVHVLHADDVVRAGFYGSARAGIIAHPEVGAAVCRVIYMDERSQWSGFSELEATAPCVLSAEFSRRQLIEQRIQFVSIIVGRTTYEELGGFRASLAPCLDWDMWTRVAMLKQIFYDPAPLACYRLHPTSDSSRLVRTGENVRYERLTIESHCARLPAADAADVRRLALRAAGVRATRRSQQLRNAGQHAAAWRQLVEALRCSVGAAVLLRSGYFLLRTIIR
jgi:hypothetical protein